MYMMIDGEAREILPVLAMNYLRREGFTKPQAEAIVKFMCESEAEENRLNPPYILEFDPVLIKTYWVTETIGEMRRLYDFDPAIASAETVDQMLDALHAREVSAVATGEPDIIVHTWVA